MRFFKKTTKIERTPMVYSNFKKKTKDNLVFGTTGLFSTSQQVVEGFIFFKTKIKIKKNIVKKKKQSRIYNARFSYWFRYNPNTFYTKKSKNARMGSGKGKFVRKSYTLKARQSFLEFKFFKKNWYVTFNRFFKTRYGLLLKFVIKKPLTLSNAHFF